MSFATKLALIGSFATSALAHGLVSGFVTDGTYNQGFLLDYYYAKVNGQAVPDIASWSAENLDNGFVDGSSYTAADIICHKNAEPGKITAKVAAGGTVEFQWTVWPDSHFGPVFTYIASCGDDCSTVDKTALKWIKIDEAGIDLDTQEWAATKLIANNNTWVTTVPESIAPGNYVFRHEIIAMHAAGSLNGAQNYPQCANIEITGSGTELPEGVLGTELYSPTDPGILFNPYTTLTNYTIPGPTLFSGASSGGSPATSAAVSATSAPAVTSAPAAIATSAVVSSVAAVPTTSAVEETPAATSTAPVATATPSTPVTCGSKRKVRRHARDISKKM